MHAISPSNEMEVEETQPQPLQPLTNTPNYSETNHNPISIRVKEINPLLLSNTSINGKGPIKVKVGAPLKVEASCIYSIPEEDQSRLNQPSRMKVPPPVKTVQGWTNGPDIKFVKVTSPTFRKQDSIKIIEAINVKEAPKLIGRSGLTCSVCEEKIKSSDITAIEGCCHVLHIECVLPYLQLKVSGGCVNIPCPFSQCNCMISQRFLRSILSEDDMARYYRFASYSFIQRNKSGDGKWEFCQEPNCNELFRIVKKPRKGKYAAPPLLECKTTHKRRCALCMGPYHPQFDSCEEYKNSKDPAYNDARLLEVVAKNNWKQCPKCKLYVEKNQGCNHIHCRCGKHFCYVCLGPYPNCNCPGAQQHMNYIPPV